MGFAQYVLIGQQVTQWTGPKIIINALCWFSFPFITVGGNQVQSKWGQNIQYTQKDDRLLFLINIPCLEQPTSQV
jgi:hypothetical protein